MGIPVYHSTEEGLIVKLYWRYKRPDGRWTYTPAKTIRTTSGETVLYGELPKGEEEE